MLIGSTVTLGSLGLGLGAVRDTLGVRGFELRCSGNADSQNQSVSYFLLPVGSLKLLWFRANIAAITRVPRLELSRRKGKRATLDKLAQTPPSRS